jgi:hypothetical protein
MKSTGAHGCAWPRASEPKGKRPLYLSRRVAAFGAVPSAACNAAHATAVVAARSGVRGLDVRRVQIRDEFVAGRALRMVAAHARPDIAVVAVLGEFERSSQQLARRMHQPPSLADSPQQRHRRHLAKSELVRRGHANALARQARLPQSADQPGFVINPDDVAARRRRSHVNLRCGEVARRQRNAEGTAASARCRTDQH